MVNSQIRISERKFMLENSTKTKNTEEQTSRENCTNICKLATCGLPTPTLANESVP